MVLSNLTTEHSTNLILDDLATRNDNWTVLDDIVTTVTSSTDAATASRLILRDASARAKVADPSAAGDIVNLSAYYTNSITGNKNKIINGNFDIWQRGTSFSASGTDAYLADRWYNSMLNTTQAVSRQAFTVGQTDVPYEPAYFHRSVIASAAAADNYALLIERIESVKTFAGQTVTLSFYAKADAAKNIAVEFVQNFGSGGSPSAIVSAIGSQKIALTTSWVKQTVTVAIPSISGKTLGTTHDGFLAVNFWFDAGSTFNARTDTLGQQSGTFDVAQVQVEAGSYATPFEKRLIGAELALCQRYFWKGIMPQDSFLYGLANRTVSHVGGFSFPVTMRVSPTMVETIAGTAENCSYGGNSKNTNGFFIYVTKDANTGTYRYYNATFTADAEL